MPNTQQGITGYQYRNFVTLMRDTAVSAADLGSFCRDAFRDHVQGSETPAGEGLEPIQPAAEEQPRRRKRASANQSTGTRRRRAPGEPTIADLAYNLLIEHGSGMTRAQVAASLAAQNIAAGSVGSALSDLRKAGRAETQNGIWQAVRQAPTAQQPIPMQPAEPMRATG